MARLRRAARAVDDNAACPAAVLLPALLARIWALLPLHTRFACACVCRAWRDAAASPEAWLSLHLRGVPHACATNALLIAAATRAAGELQTLDLGGWPWLLRSLFDEARLAPFVAIHGAALRDLRAPRRLGADDVSTLLRNAPRLRALQTDVKCDYDEARAMLRGEEPYNGALRLQCLCVGLDGEAPAALLTDLEACPFPPTGLRIREAALDAAGALDSLLDTVRTMRLRTLGLVHCALPVNAEACDALGRLLFCRDCVVTRLELVAMDSLLNTEVDAESLGVALTRTRTLTTLELREMRLWEAEPEVGAFLLGVLTVHPSLRTLILADEIPADEETLIGYTLGQFITDAERLLTLDVSGCNLGFDGLRPLLEALPRAQHLRALVLDQVHLYAESSDEDDSEYADADAEEFYESVLLPAVRSNTSLWRLRAWPGCHRGAVGQATRLVKERRLAAGIECLADVGVEFGEFTDDDEASESDSEALSAWEAGDDSALELVPEELPPVVADSCIGNHPWMQAFDFPPLEQ